MNEVDYPLSVRIFALTQGFERLDQAQHCMFHHGFGAEYENIAAAVSEIQNEKLVEFGDRIPDKVFGANPNYLRGYGAALYDARTLIDEMLASSKPEPELEEVPTDEDEVETAIRQLLEPIMELLRDIQK